MEEEMEDSGLSIGDIFRTIFSQKWLALGIAIVITIVGTIGLYLIGKSGSEYSITFVLQLPNSEDSPSTYLYPDGRNFDYTDFVSLDYLETAKSSSTDYNDVNVEKMVQNGDIKISRELTETAEGTKEYVPSYKITIKSNYFKDGDTARNFMVALSGIPVAHIAEMDIDYDYNISASQNALTYEIQLSELENQVRSLQNLYNSFIETYGSDFKVEIDGAESSSLAQLKSKTVDEYLNRGLFDTLKREALANGYVKSTLNNREKDKYISDLFAQTEKLEVAENALNQLLSLQNSSGSLIYADSIRIQIIEVEQLKQNIKYINRYLEKFEQAGEVNTEYDAKVKAVEDEVKSLTEEVKPIASYVYKNVSKVNIPDSNKITVEGGRSLVMSGLISLVVGIVIALVIAYIVGWCRQNKKSKAKAKAAEHPVFVEAQAQFAVTEDNPEENSKDNKEDK